MKQKKQEQNVKHCLSNPQGVTLEYKEGDNAVTARKGPQLYKKVPKAIKKT